MAVTVATAAAYVVAAKAEVMFPAAQVVTAIAGVVAAAAKWSTKHASSHTPEREAPDTRVGLPPF